MFGEWLVIVLLVLLPFHAFIKTWLSSLLTATTIDFLAPGSFLIASWKEIIIAILGIWWLILIVLDRKLPFVITKTDLLAGVFICLSLIYVFISPDLTASVWALKTNIAFLILYLIVRSIKQVFLKTDLVLKIIIWTTVCVNVFGWLQLILPGDFWMIFGYTPYVSSYVDYKPLPIYHGIGEQFDIIRINGSLSGPNQFGAFMACMALFLAPFAAIIRKKNTKHFWMLLTLIISTLFMIGCSFSRAAWIGLVAGALWIILLKTSLKFKWLLVSGLCAIGLLGVFGMYLYAPTEFDTYIVHGASTSERIERWTEGAQLSLEHPLGMGLGQAGPVSRRMYGEETGIITENWYLQIALETGIISALLFILILTAVLFETYRGAENATETKARAFSVGVHAATVSLAVNGLFLHTWDDSTVAYIWAILCALAIQKYVHYTRSTDTLNSKALGLITKQRTDESSTRA